MSLIERLDEIRGRWNVLAHPFYRRWEAGELSRAELATYAEQYRHAVEALADTAAATGDPEHAAEERAHVDLWDDFAAAVGAKKHDEPNPETLDCADAWRRTDPLEARAVLYSIEAAQPAISRTKLAGLVEHYGFEPGTASTKYFDVHAERDHEHAAASRNVLLEASDAKESELVAAAERALVGNWRLLDAVSAVNGTDSA
jgi:pyrroloquinoline-quinone synthase